jgi:hypothetical protein
LHGCGAKATGGRCTPQRSAHGADAPQRAAVALLQIGVVRSLKPTGLLKSPLLVLRKTSNLISRDVWPRLRGQRVGQTHKAFAFGISYWDVARHLHQASGVLSRCPLAIIRKPLPSILQPLRLVVGSVFNALKVPDPAL